MAQRQSPLAAVLGPIGYVGRAVDALGRWRLALIGVLLLVAAGAAYWYLRDGTSAKFVTAPVSRGTVAQAVTATGSVNPMLTVIVGTYVSGVIQQIHCDFNTRVKKGQLCAKIDPRPYEAVVAQDRANVAGAQAQLLKDRANLEYAQISLKRYTSLFAQHAASRDSYDTARNMLKQAQAQVALDEADVAQRQAALSAAQVNLGYTNIVSPVDGIVVARNVTVGQTVAASFQTPTLFLIAEDLSKLQVDTNVSEGDIGGIRVGDEAQFRVEAYSGRMFRGTVTQIRKAPQTVQNVVTYDVVVAADNSELLLIPGMTATVRIITDKRSNALRVPDQALRYTPNAANGNTPTTGKQVWVLRGSRSERVPVTTGLDDDTYSEITGGALSEGDRVILSESANGSRKSGNGGPAMRFQ